MSKEITKATVQCAHDVIVSGYFNQNVGSNAVQTFMGQNVLFEESIEVNNI